MIGKKIKVNGKSMSYTLMILPLKQDTASYK